GSPERLPEVRLVEYGRRQEFAVGREREGVNLVVLLPRGEPAQLPSRPQVPKENRPLPGASRDGVAVRGQGHAVLAVLRNQSPLFLPRGGIPGHDDAVAAAGDDQVSLGGVCQAVHVAPEAVEAADLVPRDVPYADRFVRAPGGERLAVRCKG